MNFTLNDLEQLKTNKKNDEEQYIVDREMYMQGRRCYPSAPSEGLSERARGCYMMGFNMSQMENSYAN